MNKVIKTSLLVMITVLSMALLMPAAMAYDHDQTYDANATYFVVEDVRSPDSSDRTVEVWINTSVGVTNGLVKFSYDPSCANVTSATINTVDWDSTVGVTLLTGETWLSFSEASGSGNSGITQIAELTIQCTGSSSCCGTVLGWITGGSALNYVDDLGYGQGPIPGVNWANGTYICGEPLVVEKTVWDGSNWVNVLGLTSDQMGEDVRFNITVTSECLDLSNVEVSDTMDAGLVFNDTPSFPRTVGTLAAGASWSTEFNATIDGYGPQDNTATATATIDDLSGIGVQASDIATVNTCPPAGFGVNKTVWDGNAWVELVSGAEIGNTYRFRVEVTNTGSPTMNICDMVVTDVLPANLAYADNAMLQDHHGIWHSLPNPPAIYDPANNTYGWIINNTVPGECLQPLQKIVIEYNATVTNYGLGTNNVTAEGYCAVAGQWVQESDNASIDVPKPDLTVSDITINYAASSVKNKAIGPKAPGTRTQCNNLSATIKELNDVDVEFDFDVKFEVNGAELNCSPATVSAVMTGGSEVTVYCDCSFYPIAGVDYNISVTADSGGAIIESDEDNNTHWRNVTGQVNGYKGDGWQDGRNISAPQCYPQGHINLIYSAGDSYYENNAGWTTYTVNWTAINLSSIPTSDANIKKARLYVYRSYDTDVNVTQDPEQYFNLTFNGYLLPIDKKYHDYKFEGEKAKVGMMAYDVSHKLKVGDDNTAVLTTSYPGGKPTCILSMLLVVVYEHPDEPERIIWINEGTDVLYARDSYSINSEEATTYAEFEDCEPMPADFRKATLVTVAPWGNEGNDNNRLFFNDGMWNGVWNPASDIFVPNGPFSVARTDVTNHLKPSDNIAAFQSHIPDGATKGDYMAAANAFLIVEKRTVEMSVEPDSEECYDVGEQFDVRINIDPMGVPIRGAEFDLKYNQDAISVLTLAVGDFLEPPVSIGHSNIDNGNGVASFAASMTGGTGGATTPGTFAIVHCMAIGQGVNSTLNLTTAIAYDNSTPIMLEVTVDTLNGSVEVCDNAPPVPVAMSNFTYNNMADKVLSKAYFNSIGSYDPDDGIITMYEWTFGDGQTGVGPAPEHAFIVKQYWDGVDASGHYVPATVTLTVTDDGMPLMDNTTQLEVNVWIGGDANGDGRVNLGDAVMVGYYWGSSPCDTVDGLSWAGKPYADMADLNNDGRVNLLDTIPVGFCWGHTAW